MPAHLAAGQTPFIDLLDDERTRHVEERGRILRRKLHLLRQQHDRLAPGHHAQHVGHHAQRLGWQLDRRHVLAVGHEPDLAGARMVERRHRAELRRLRKGGEWARHGSFAWSRGSASATAPASAVAFARHKPARRRWFGVQAQSLRIFLSVCAAHLKLRTHHRTGAENAEVRREIRSSVFTPRNSAFSAPLRWVSGLLNSRRIAMRNKRNERNGLLFGGSDYLPHGRGCWMSR